MKGQSGTPAVTRALRQLAWPALRQLGFTVDTSRTVWRSNVDTVDVINVAAVVGKAGSRLILLRPDGSLGSAAFGSFVVRAGTYYAVRSVLPYATSVYGRPRDVARPLEYQCDRRTTLVKTLVQNPAYPPNIWAVAEDGAGAERAVADALEAIRAQALSFFRQNADLESVFHETKQICWGMAQSPQRQPDHFFIQEDLFTAMAIRLGRVHEAIALFEAIAARPYDPAEQRRHDEQDERRIRRAERSSRRARLTIERLPFWHQGAVRRLDALVTFAG